MSHWFYTDANFLLLYSSGLISFLCSWFWDSQSYGFSRGAGPSLRAPCFSRTGPCGSQGNGRFPGSAAPAPGSADGLRSGCRAPGPGGMAAVGVSSWKPVPRSGPTLCLVKPQGLSRQLGRKEAQGSSSILKELAWKPVSGDPIWLWKTCL